MLPASTNPYFGLAIANSKAADYGLKIGPVWWALGMALATGYTINSHRHISGKVSVTEGDGNQH
jgi:cytochrome d ubiquinol oxidase subunit II